MKFKLIMVFVDDLKVEKVLDAGRQASATGATIIPSARGQGVQRHLTFFGFEYLAARTIVLFVVEARRSADLLQAVTEAAGLDESVDTGIALELDVDRAMGLSQHIEMLQKEHPLEDG